MSTDLRRGALATSLLNRVARATAGSLFLLALVGTAVALAAPGDVGHKDHSFGTGTSAPTGEKPESKLWYNDGFWWGSLRGATGGYFIYRLNPATELWVNTGVAIDDRVGSHADMLWDGTKLYAASQNFSTSGSLTGGTARLYRYSYNSSTDTYSLDGGFPITMRANIRSETLVIAKDSTGMLWATWTQPSGSNRVVYTNHTTTSDSVWSTPAILPVGSQGVGVTTSADDISSIIAFKQTGQTGRIGVFWSNQTDLRDYFAWHVDGDPDGTWTAETAIAPGGSSNPRPADDHINLKADSNGRVYAMVKTSNDSGSLPEMVLHVRQWGGGWTHFTVGTGSTHTRPIVVLDETAGVIHSFLTGPTPPDTTGVSGGTIYEKTSSMSSISFVSGLGTAVIRDNTRTEFGDGVNNATSTKQNVNSTTGLVVMSSDDPTDFYWHDHDLLGGGGGGGAPVADFSGTPTTGPPGQSVAFTDLSTNAPTSWAWNFGDPASGGQNTSTLQNPSHTYASAGQYTVQLTATNGSGPGSITKTNYITITSGGGSSTITLTPNADAKVSSGAQSTNYGTTTDLRVREENPIGTSTFRSFLRFNVQGLTGTVTGVKLRLFTTDESPSIQSVYATVTNPNWIESGTGSITWTNAPTIGSTVYGSASVPTLNAYNEITLDPSAVSGNGLVTYALKSVGGSNNAVFNSKEAASNPPQLVITQTTAPSNTPPTANATSATVGEDGSGPVALSGSDPDTGNCELTFSLVTPPTKGTVNFAGQTAVPCVSGSPNTDSTSVTYTPNANANGTDSFTYKVNDGTADSSPATASITITPDNDAPTAQATSASTTVNTAKVITLTGTDIDSCDLTFVSTQATHGTVSAPTNPAGCATGNPNTDTATVTYTPDNAYTGPDSFTFTVNDGALTSPSATVSITVTASNTPPTANATSATVGEDGSGPVALSGSDPDTGNCELTFSLVTPPTKGTVNFAGQTAVPCVSGSPNTDSTSVTYTPNANANGTDSFTYKVNDGTADSSPATASITITSVNDTPTANAVTTSTPQNTPKIITLSGSDVETCDLVFARTQGTHGTVSAVTDNACSGSGPFTDSVTVTYTPDTGYSGPDSFTYTVADATATSIPATVSITVNASSSSVTVPPAADAKVTTAAPDTNYGTTTDLRTREENPIATTTYRSYLKFNVPALSGTISSIKLRLFVTSASVDATGVYPVADNSWIESGTGGITWNNAKPIGATLLGSAVAGPSGAYIEISLNASAITADGVARTYSFAIKAAANHSGTYSSKEAASNPPQLVIVTGP